jgi:protein-L-isoaspartate(D-aspartate) O-methyltransferase
MVGPGGSVATVDIFPDAATEAREHLAAAGYADVTVVCGDGELGVPEGGPYRIIVTAGRRICPRRGLSSSRPVAWWSCRCG